MNLLDPFQNHKSLQRYAYESVLSEGSATIVRTLLSKMTQEHMLKDWFLANHTFRALRLMDQDAYFPTFIQAIKENRNQQYYFIDCKLLLKYNNTKSEDFNPFFNILPKRIKDALEIEEKIIEFDANAYPSNPETDQVRDNLIANCNVQLEALVSNPRDV